MLPACLKLIYDASASPTAETTAMSTIVSSVEASETTTMLISTTLSAAVSTSSDQPSTVSGVDFGLCVPTMKFEGGLDGRPATEFTFLPIDPLCAEGQQEALNPSMFLFHLRLMSGDTELRLPDIITNRICDQLTNVCEANDAAKSLCRSAQAQIQALGTRDKSTADTWNSLLGFAGAVTNPDGGPAEPPSSSTTVAATPAARKMRRFVA